MAKFKTNPDGSREVDLVAPITWADDQAVVAIRLRPPSYAEIMRHGDPSSLIVFAGAVMPQHDPAVIKAYVEVLAKDQHGNKVGPAIIERCDYRDALALRDAVLDFFETASASTSTTTPTP